MGKQSRTRAMRKINKENCEKTSEIKKEYVSLGDNDLFDNPLTRAAMAALSEEDKERYRVLGEHMFSGVNFEDCQSLNNMPPSMSEAVAYIETQIKSGLHISELEDNEKSLMKDAYGDEWYTRWGYIEEDLDSFVTLEPTFTA